MKRLGMLAMTALLMVWPLVDAVAEAGNSDTKTPLTHADAAVILAKYAGFFDRYVSADASLSDCVRFLNRHGVFFNLLHVSRGLEFTEEDCARAMGQIDLLLSGHAQFSMGKVKLPKGIESWVEFCTMHGVDYVKGHRAMLKIYDAGKAGKE